MEAEATHAARWIKILAWLEVNKKKVAIWSGGLVALVLVVVVVLTAQAQRETRASEALSELRLPLNLTEPLSPELTTALEQIARDYDGTKAAGRARLLHASALFNRQEYAGAREQFEAFLGDYPNSPWTAQALFGVAASLDAQKLSAEAIAKYEELRRRFATHSLVDEARLCLARLYEDENRLEEALQIYDELVQTHPNDGLGAEAGMRQQDMLERYPHLAPTNAPVSILPTMVTNAPIQLNLEPAPSPGPVPVPVPAPAPVPDATIPPAPGESPAPPPDAQPVPPPPASTPAPAPPEGAPPPAPQDPP